MIKNILLDLGGVIMDIERSHAVKALEEAGMPTANDMLGEYGQKGPFLALEKGDIDADEFHRQLRPYFTREVTDDEIDNAFIQFLVGIPVSRLRDLEKMHGRYRLYMLSNTNPIMWEKYIKDAFKQDGHDMDYYFDGVVASFAAHAYKPDARIFEYAVEQLGIVPGETLFLDDSTKNLEAAAALGFQTAHVTPEKPFATLVP